MPVFRRSAEDGAAAVELGLILPILVTLVFGIVEFSRGYNALVSLDHAAREGVRVLAITGDQSQAISATKNAATSLPPAKVNVTTTACTSGQPTQVTATYPFTFAIPMVRSATVTLTGRGVMRCGG